MNISPSNFINAAQVGDLETVRTALDSPNPPAANLKFAAMKLAATKGQNAVINLLLERGTPVNATDSSETALHAAVRCSQLNIVRLLVAHKASVNCYTDTGQTPLHLAANDLNIDIARILLKKGADPDAITDLRDNTPLHQALNFATHVELREKFVALLLKHGACPNIANSFGITPLHAAVRFSENLTRLLLNAGALPCTITKDRETTMHFAAISGNRNIVELLLDEDVSTTSTTNKNKTPLHIASDNNNKDVVKLLLQKGVSVNAKDTEGETALHLARDREIAQLLLSNGANIDARDEKGYTPLHKATIRGDINVVRLLLNNGCSVNTTNFQKQTPLHHCMLLGGYYEITKLLVDHGAIVNATSDQGTTPLMYSAAYGLDRITQLLLDKGASTEIENENEITALKIAIHNYEKSSVEILLKNGVVVEIEHLQQAIQRHLRSVAEKMVERGVFLENFEQSALRAAIENHHQDDLAYYLIYFGADVNAISRDGFSMLQTAVITGDEKIAQMILNSESFNPDL